MLAPAIGEGGRLRTCKRPFKMPSQGAFKEQLRLSNSPNETPLKPSNPNTRTRPLRTATARLIGSRRQSAEDYLEQTRMDFASQYDGLHCSPSYCEAKSIRCLLQVILRRLPAAAINRAVAVRSRRVRVFGFDGFKGVLQLGGFDYSWRRSCSLRSRFTGHFEGSFPSS